MLAIVLIVIAVVLLASVVLTYCRLVNKISVSLSPGRLNSIKLAIPMTLLICPFDNLYVYILLEISSSMLLALQVIAMDVVIVIVVVNVRIILVLAEMCIYSLLVRRSPL